MLVCNWLAPEAGESFQELTVIGTEGTAWIEGGKLRALAGELGSPLPGEGESRVYLAAQSEAGHAASAAAANQPDYDAVAAMLDAALATLGDADVRTAATTDTLQTARVAVQAQEMARAEKELP